MRNRKRNQDDRKDVRTMASKPNLIHARCDRKMQPFYWILSFECFSLLIIFGLAMAGLSGYGAAAHGGWAFLLLFLVVAGLWLAWKGYRLLEKFVWETKRFITTTVICCSRFRLLREGRCRNDSFGDAGIFLAANYAGHYPHRLDCTDCWPV